MDLFDYSDDNGANGDVEDGDTQDEGGGMLDCGDL